MKKRIFARALALFMALSLLSTTAFAAVLDQAYVDNQENWTSDQYGNYVVLGEGDYTMDGAVSTDRIIQVNGTTTTLDLNGETLTHTGETGSAVMVTNGGSLTIKDSAGPDADGNYEGTITGGKGIKGYVNAWDNYGGGIYVNGESDLTLESGTISGNTPGYGGSGVHVTDNSTFTMNGGSITDNTTRFSGGGVSVTGNSTFTMNGGSIDNNTSKGSAGAGVYVSGNSEFVMMDGEITGNQSQFGGGGVYVKDGTFTMENGVISGNKSITKTGGGVYVEKTANLTINGGKIINNTANGYNGIAGNPSPDKISSDALICNGDTDGIVQHDDTVVTEIPATYDAPGERSYHCSICNEVVRTEEIPQLTRPADDSSSNDTSNDAGEATPPVSDFTGGMDADTTTITDDEIPLAGLLTLADLLEELRVYEEIPELEIPEDFKWIDHELAQAIYWGLQEELVVDTEEDPLDPDELLTVGLMREVLTNFVEIYKGLDGFTVELEGEDEDLVMDYIDMISRLAPFYEELEAALEAKAA